jgi:hypothetical protein
MEASVAFTKSKPMPSGAELLETFLKFEFLGLLEAPDSVKEWFLLKYLSAPNTTQAPTIPETTSEK